MNLAQETVAILGLGLIGGSLARDLAARGSRVIGFDVDTEQLEAAQRAGVVHTVISDDLAPLSAATVVVIAAPVDVAPALLERIAPHLGAATLVTDVGSTKLVIGERASTLGVQRQFVGAHPMAGDHRTGFRASREGLFRGARVYLCPNALSSDSARRAAAEFWTALDSEVVWTVADAHDEVVAYTSHLPHLLSAALQRTIAAAGHEAQALGAGGRDMTRLSRSSPAMWRAIVSTNSAAIARALADCAAQLDEVRDMVARQDHDAVARIFTEAGTWSARIAPPERSV